MHYVVEPSALASGAVTVPGDKSISHRALILGGIADGRTDISGFLPGEDCLATLAALRSMGVSIDRVSDTRVSVDGCGSDGLRVPSGPLDMGNSGTAMRLFAGLLSGQSFSSKLIGDASLSQRPMSRIIDPLTSMGAQIDSSDGKPPLLISGERKLSGVVYQLPVASAQVKSAILLAGLFAEGETTVIEPATTRDHTERMLRAMGVDIRTGETQIVMPGGQRLTGAAINVPADLSSAAFIILASAIASDCEVTLVGVGVNPTRTGVIDILRSMGADISLDNVRLFGEEPVADIVVRSSELHGIDVDPAMVSLAIDEFPILFIAAAMAKGKTSFSGIGELRVKESDRIATMAQGLRILGIDVDETDDGAVVHGGVISGGSVKSHGDHRIAMSFAVAATRAGWPVRIEDTAAVDTSFPGFVDCLRSLGVGINSFVDDEIGVSV
jgi:3-phosphoshikimate 1-carboxyvinyltransferase